MHGLAKSLRATTRLSCNRVLRGRPGVEDMAAMASSGDLADPAPSQHHVVAPAQARLASCWSWEIRPCWGWR
jgi:hypothetical protein